MKYTILLCLLVSALVTTAQEKPQFEKGEFFHKGRLLPYRILKPVDFDSSKQYPLHIFLHGAGERGSDNAAQLIHGSDLFVEKNSEFPAIVIFPQCPVDDYWAQINFEYTNEERVPVFEFPKESEPGWAMSAVMTMIKAELEEPYIDSDRVYLSGLSMGGMGTFELLYRMPDTFAAATPICGGGNPEHIPSWGKPVPLWVFHGDTDNVVPALYSQVMVDALKAGGFNPKFSLYPSVGHDSWTSAFAEPDLFSWIYSHRKK